MKEKRFCENTVISILDCVDCFRYKLTIACKIEEANLKQNQVKIKQLYDKYAMKRKFKSGENVIVFLLIRCLPLHATYCWPFVIESRLNDLNYIVNTPTTRKKRQICQMTTQGFSKEYKLTVDTSDVGVGAVSLQEGKDDIDLPNCYFFLKSLTTIRTNNPQLIKKAF